jgi:glycerophosphoryl diester phosphodiesterase
MKPRVLAHRGIWTAPSEKNSLEALKRALARGYGIETDIRDLDGNLVISHDPPRFSTCLPLASLFELYVSVNATGYLALNIKADGLAKPLKTLLELHRIETAFVFDLSVPDMVSYLELGFSVFTRRSDVELAPAFYKKCAGVWIDSFDVMYSPSAWGREALNDGKSIALVSPELHDRSHLQAWQDWRYELSPFGDDSVMICTDFPEDAEAFFREK